MHNQHIALANAMGPTQWLILLVIVLVLFGGSRIPEMMKGLGSGLREFKKGLHDESEERAEREEQNKSANGAE